MERMPEEEFVCPHCDSAAFDIQVVTKVDNFGVLLHTRTYRTIVCSECGTKARVRAVDPVRYKQRQKLLEEDPYATETTNEVQPPNSEDSGRPMPMKLKYDRDSRRPQRLWF